MKFPNFEFTNMLTAGLAAERLARHLGKTSQEWLTFLRADARRRRTEREVACVRQSGRLWYPEPDLYGFILLRNPVALEADGPTTPRKTNRYGFHPEVFADVDFEDSARPFVRMEMLEANFGPTGLTAVEARQLAQQLLEAANRCEQIYPQKVFELLSGYCDATI